MYLLDTNHCSRLIDNDSSIVQRLRELDDVLITTCVIVQGELSYMVERSTQKGSNQKKVHAFLQDIEIYPVDEDSADIYGQIKASIFKHFGPKDKSKRIKTKLEKLGFRENDLWIAAIAKRNRFIIVSADRDFERIKEIEDLSLECWVEPEVDKNEGKGLS